MLPVVGRPARYRFNVIPRDFVIQAMTYLSGLTTNAGKTYALADPQALTVDETIDVIAAAGIVAPRLRDYAPRLVEFARAHPEIGSAAMV